MDTKTRYQARLTAHAIDRYDELLVHTLDTCATDLSPECVRWGAVSDPRGWLRALQRSDASDALHAVLTFAEQHAIASEDLEDIIVHGAACRDSESLGALRDELLFNGSELSSALRNWAGR